MFCFYTKLNLWQNDLLCHKLKPVEELQHINIICVEKNKICKRSPNKIHIQNTHNSHFISISQLCTKSVTKSSYMPNYGLSKPDNCVIINGINASIDDFWMPVFLFYFISFQSKWNESIYCIRIKNITQVAKFCLKLGKSQKAPAPEFVLLIYSRIAGVHDRHPLVGASNRESKKVWTYKKVINF